MLKSITSVWKYGKLYWILNFWIRERMLIGPNLVVIYMKKRTVKFKEAQVSAREKTRKEHSWNNTQVMFTLIMQHVGSNKQGLLMLKIEQIRKIQDFGLKRVCGWMGGRSARTLMASGTRWGSESPWLVLSSLCFMETKMSQAEPHWKPTLLDSFPSQAININIFLEST